MGKLEKIREFFAHDIWAAHEGGTKKWWFVRLARIAIFTATSSGRHDTGIRSAALAFFTVMSLVPILAIAFAVAKGFGMDARLVGLLYDQFPDYTQVVDILMGFVNNLLARTKGGVMAVGAFTVLIWAVVQVFGQVEGAFNNIWEVKNTRSAARRFGTYLGVVLGAPILLLASYTIMIAVRAELGGVAGGRWFEALYDMGSLVAVVAVFTLIYGVIPNTKVRFRNALISGAVAGVIFWGFQMLYFLVQRELGSYNAIYGAFAAVPLFLLWIQIGWQIVLYGGELAFGLQNVASYEQERMSLGVSHDVRCKIMISSMVIILREYLDGKPGLANSEMIAGELHVPIRLVRDVMHELERDGLVLFVAGEKNELVNNYVPAIDPHTIRFMDVLERVSANGIELRHSSGSFESPLMARIGAIYDKVKRNTLELPENMPLVDLIAGPDADRTDKISGPDR